MKIKPSEFERRIEQCAIKMQALSLDCTVIFPGPGFTYFTGLMLAKERYRITVAIIDADNSMTTIGPCFEEAKMKTALPRVHIETWTDEEDQHGRIADLILSKFGSKVHVALEPTTEYYHFVALQQAMPNASFLSASEITDDLRAIKSDAEVACLEEAASRTYHRLVKVPSMLAEGMTEKDLAKLLGSGVMVQFGLTTASPNAAAGNRRLMVSDVVVVDAGDRVEGYRSDLTRTFLFGEPTKRMLDIYRIVREAESAAIEAAKPGRSAAAVDIAAREVINRAGFSNAFSHRGGHGLGLGFHEIPICAASSKDILLPGMVLTAEPGIYLEGEFGIRLEDDLLITETGNRLLSTRGPFFV